MKRSVLSGEEWDPSHRHHHGSDSGGGMSERTWVEPNCCCHIWSVDKNTLFINDDIVFDEQLTHIYIEQNMKKNTEKVRVVKSTKILFSSTINYTNFH